MSAAALNSGRAIGLSERHCRTVTNHSRCRTAKFSPRLFWVMRRVLGPISYCVPGIAQIRLGPQVQIPGNRAGSFQGPPQESGPRSQAQWVPPKNGNAGYWKTQQPGQKGWARFRDGKPITPEEAHPRPEAQTARSQSFWQQYKILRIPLIGPLICFLFCESPAK
jgi:hypothetical protein